MKDEIKVAVAAMALMLLIVLSTYASWANASSSVVPPTATPLATPQISQQAQVCINCHQQANAALVHNWEDSKHIAFGVDCFTCHDAKNKGNRADIRDHYGFKIITQVTVSDCQDCHGREIPGNGK